MNWLANFPGEKALLCLFPETEVLNVNAHIHTPFSFSSFTDIPQIFELARNENIAALGINDFFVTDGYDMFYTEATKNGVFPLFNIEFIGLLRNEQRAGIRVNDPNNPGRCYFCGKGLDYPFHTDAEIAQKLKTVIDLSQQQIVAMIEKLNQLFADLHTGIAFDYNNIKLRFARNLVRERHLAKAVRDVVFDRYKDDTSRSAFFTKLFNGASPKPAMTDIPGLENEIRANLLKAGGSAFVEEDEATFLSIEEVMDIIKSAGGIPCYPVLLDDRNGKYTEYENSPEKLRKELSSKNIGCIELIPGRNDAAILESFTQFFHEKGFVILMGTEHNTPDLAPLTCDTRGKKPLPDRLKQISYEGACVIAAHQYLRARGKEGFIGRDGKPRNYEKESFIKLGNALIHYQNHLKKS